MIKNFESWLEESEDRHPKRGIGLGADLGLSDRPISDNRDLGYDRYGEQLKAGDYVEIVISDSERPSHEVGIWNNSNPNWKGYNWQDVSYRHYGEIIKDENVVKLPEEWQRRINGFHERTAGMVNLLTDVKDRKLIHRPLDYILTYINDEVRLQTIAWEWNEQRRVTLEEAKSSAQKLLDSLTPYCHEFKIRPDGIYVHSNFGKY